METPRKSRMSLQMQKAYARSIVIGGGTSALDVTVPATGGAGATITRPATRPRIPEAVRLRPLSPGSISPLNNTLHATDILLTSAHAVPGLPPGGSQSASLTSLTIPAVSTGSYYIIAKADDGNAIVESKETNSAAEGDHHRRQPRRRRRSLRLRRAVPGHR